MSRERGSNDTAGQPGGTDDSGPSESTSGAASTSRARPPRPTMSDSTPAPVRRLGPPTPTVRVARGLWLTSLALGAIAGFFVFLYRADQLERLRELVTDFDSSLDSETVDAVTLIVFWGGLGALALVLLLEAISLNILLRGHGGARWALIGMLVVHACTLVLADSVLIAPDQAGLYLWILLLAQLVLASTGLVFSFLPGASRWFRAEREARRRPRG